MLNKCKKMLVLVHTLAALDQNRAQERVLGCWLPADFSLSVGCFGHPNIHEMVSDQSSRAENWSDLRNNSMRIF